MAVFSISKYKKWLSRAEFHLAELNDTHNGNNDRLHHHGLKYVIHQLYYVFVWLTTHKSFRKLSLVLIFRSLLDNKLTNEIWRLITGEILRPRASFPEFSDLTDNEGEREEGRKHWTGTVFTLLGSTHCDQFWVVNTKWWTLSSLSDAPPDLIYSIHKHHPRVWHRCSQYQNLNTKMKFSPDICLSARVCPWHCGVMN